MDRLPEQGWMNGREYYSYQCTKCGDKAQNTYCEPHYSRMLKNQTCFTCDYWDEFEEKNEPTSMTIIDGHVYSPGNRTSGSMREALEQMDNLVDRIPGASDERDTMPILLGIEKLWPIFRAALSSPAPDGLSEEPVAWLRDLQPDAEDEALAVCNRIDAGAFPVYTSPRLDREKLARALWTDAYPEYTAIFDRIVARNGLCDTGETQSMWDKVHRQADAIMRETR